MVDRAGRWPGQAIDPQRPAPVDFRAEWSPDGSRILFCRAATGNNPAIWTVDVEGKEQRFLTRGIDDQGADFPKWIPS